MPKESFVTNDLHRIGDHIAESIQHNRELEHSKQEKNEPEAVLSDNFPASVVRKNEKPSAARTAPPSSVSAESSAAAAPELPPEQVKALRKRREEFLRVRRDLAGRFAQQTAALETELKELTVIQKKRNDLLSEMNRLQTRLDETIPDNPPDVPNTPDFAAACKSLENLRLETFRLMARAEKESGMIRSGVSAPAQERRTAAGNGMPDWGSLTFGQLFRLGLGVGLPALIVIFFSVLLLCAAIIAALNGAIRWS